jgi:predicted TIM-barrel fold metal-dependent hydrolase
MTSSLPSAVRSTRPPGAAGAIDVDVHAVLPVQLNAVLAYMPRAWREKLAYIGTPPLASSPLHYTYLAGKYVVDPGVPAAALRTPEPVIAGVLDELEQRAAFGQLFATDAVTHAMQSGNPDMAATVAAAFNDFMLDQWLGDGRLRYALAVAPQSPALAVAEIRRHGDDPRVSSVWVPSMPTKLSHPSLRPVLAAAIEHGLAVVCHPGSGRIAMTPAPYADEGRFNAPLTAWGELAGLVAHGTFTRLPDLRVAFLDCGFAWLDALLARMGDPDDLIRAHVRIAAAGDGDRGAPEWARLIERPGSVLPDVLVYSGRAPTAIFEALSEPVRLRVLTENATAVVRI